VIFARESGLLLHPTSLPGPRGIGEIGAEAMRWLEMLREMEQRLWQILPLGPTGYGDSPYQGLSSFAANPLMLDLDGLRLEGLLEGLDLEQLPSFPADRVDFGSVIPARTALLRRAARAFGRHAAGQPRADFEEFRRLHSGWLDDWALFDALKQSRGGDAWTSWPIELRDRDPAALARAREELAAEIEQTEVLQYLFARQWGAVRGQAADLGIRLIGDIPIFVAHDSADVWQRRDLFQLDEGGEPTVVAGVPPDYFSSNGQRWGNPLYRWEAHRAEDFAWWIARLRRVLETVDVVRIDHFRGFAASWEIPATEPTATRGRWAPAPGAELFAAVGRNLGALPIIAEDLGLITPDVAALRDGLAYPGMRVLQFAFGSELDERGENPHLPENLVENCVAYTGTHDNDTLAGWLSFDPGSSTRDAAEIELERGHLLEVLQAHFGVVPADLRWACIEILLASRAAAAVVPLQDILGLGSEARMNTPGRPEGNWSWRFRWEQLRPELRDRLAQLTRRHRAGSPGRAR
jgi:4-alpha-glucanotransferase